MNFKNFLSSSFLIKSVFIGSLVILIFISSVSYKHTLVITDLAELVTHSYEVRIELEQLNSRLTDAESAKQGYMLSKDSIFFKAFNNAHAKVNKSFFKLNQLAANNLRQQNNLDSLYGLINFRFENLSDSFKETPDTSHQAITLKKNLRDGKKLMDKIHIQIQNMINLEIIYLHERQKKYENEISFTPIFTFLVFLFSLIVFVFSYFKINENLFILKKANKQLIITTESFKQAEEIANISSWYWDLELNLLVYSDNLYRLLGCEPQSFKPSIKKFLEFVHPSDIHLIIQGDEEVVNDNKPPTAIFRVIRKDGELRYFKSIGKVLIDKNGKKTLIGINSDVTEQYLSNVSLEERNQELERTNKELASFNHVASHDLQEPLRKIQTFISRIAEKEVLNMSETGKDYFSRIHTAVDRMRILINDLLLFSSTNKIEKIFEPTDFNVLLENVQQELAQAIEDKNAVIEAGNLPTLNVIPFQIQQLFTNLIGNSLKYSKPNVVPVVKIRSELIIAKDYPILKMDTTKKYYKISFTDNGLGFEQEYAENIFILFRRLHHVKEYPGTGIGLSICKKIVENHAGFIEAEGNLGIGSTFTVFFPA